MRVPPLAFFITKYFGSGVIIATAFIHVGFSRVNISNPYANVSQLLAPANEALTNPCLTGPITEYSWVEAITLMTIFTMFFIELMASRFDIFGEQGHDVESADPSKSALKNEKLGNGYRHNHGHTHGLDDAGTPDSSPAPSTKAPTSDPFVSDRSETNSGEGPSRVITNTRVPGREDDFSYPPGGEDHLGHQRSHDGDHDHFAAQMTAIFILEFGVIFHSVFIGLTLAVTGDNFNILYIVLVFHQTFEGLGLGSRLATADWPKKKKWMPWVLGTAYGFTTPIAIAIGLGVRTTFTPGSQNTLIVNGVFDSISAGILIYTGLVELMAHEFMFNPEMRKSSIKMMLFAYLCICVGAGLMALLGKWA
jgi:zinc transporter 1/2/3